VLSQLASAKSQVDGHLAPADNEIAARCQSSVDELMASVTSQTQSAFDSIAQTFASEIAALEGALQHS
jgi:hypothetical protein